MTSPKKEYPYHYDKQTLLSEQVLPIKIKNSARRKIELQFVKILELNNLNKHCIKISDLSPNNENQNCFIYATQISTVADGETIRFIVEDEFDNVCRVSIPGNADTTHLVEGVRLAFHNPIYELAFDKKYSLIIYNIYDINLFKTPTKSSPELFEIDNACSAYLLPNREFEIDSCDESESTIKLTSQPTSLVDNTVGVDSSITQKQTGEDSTLEIIDSELFPKRSETETKHSQRENPFQACVDLPQAPEVVLVPGDDLSFSEIGNKFFKEGCYLQAIMQYTCAIQVNDKNAKFYSNRALCYNKFEEFENALSDFQKANLLDPDCGKYQYLIALTWSRIGNHILSLNLLRKIKPIDTIDSSYVFKLIEKEEVYVKHFSGDFDFINIRLNLSELSSNSIDIADYIGPIQILYSHDKGRGIFTTRNVKKGENLCVVKATEIMNYDKINCPCRKCRRYNFNNMRKDKTLHNEIIEKARKSKLTTVRIISLCDKSITKVNIDLYSGCGYEFAKNFDTTPYPMDKLHSLAEDNIQIEIDQCILPYQLGHTQNTFPQQPFVSTIVGLWFLPNFISHSCIPNAVKIYIGDICIVRAITDIPEGDEVSTCFIPLSLISNTHVPSCNCRLCLFERIPAVKEINSQLSSQLNTLNKFENPRALSSRCVMMKPEQKFEKITMEMWFEIRSNLFELIKKLKLLETYEVFSVNFQKAIVSLLQMSLQDSDALELYLEAEPYFSHFEPENYVIFWTSFHSCLLENEKLRDHRFQHVETKYNDLIELFT